MDTRFETMDSKETSAIVERYPLFCHASTSALARNDGKRGFFTQDSRSCGGALCDSKNLGGRSYLWR